MNQFTTRPYVEIAADRAAAIRAGAKIIPKSACHYCAWTFQAKEIFCCAECATLYQAECAAATAPAIDKETP